MTTSNECPDIWIKNHMCAEHNPPSKDKPGIDSAPQPDTSADDNASGASKTSEETKGQSVVLNAVGDYLTKANKLLDDALTATEPIMSRLREYVGEHETLSNGSGSGNTTEAVSTGSGSAESCEHCGREVDAPGDRYCANEDCHPPRKEEKTILVTGVDTEPKQLANPNPTTNLAAWKPERAFDDGMMHIEACWNHDRKHCICITVPQALSTATVTGSGAEPVPELPKNTDTLESILTGVAFLGLNIMEDLNPRIVESAMAKIQILMSQAIVNELKSVVSQLGGYHNTYYTIETINNRIAELENKQ